MVVVKSAEKPPFQVPVELSVLLSYHFTGRHFQLLAPEIDASDVVCPESMGLCREDVPFMRAGFRGTEEDKRRSILLQYTRRLSGAAYNAALISHLFNHPHIVFLDFSETREEASDIQRLHTGESGAAISAFMRGRFEEALSFGFDTVESRARAFDLRYRQLTQNAAKELPPVVNGIRPAHGDRVRCAILFGSEDHELSVVLSEGLRGAGDVVVSMQRPELSASVGFDRLVHDVVAGGMKPLSRDDEHNRELLARGLLDVVVLNFYPPNSPVRTDGAQGSRIITKMSDKFGLPQIEKICNEAGVGVMALKDEPELNPSLIWSETLKNHGVRFPPTYPTKPLGAYL